MSASPAPFSILAVCTGNICRSPALELRLRRLLGPEVEVVSAGLHARVGEPVDPTMAVLLGPGVEDLRARQVTAADVAGADLVLTMTAEQRRALSVRVPTAVRRIFTLREFAELAELARTLGHVPSTSAPCTGLPEALAALVAAAPRLRNRRSGGDDVEDPYRRGGEVFVRALATIDAAVARIGRALCLSPPDHVAS